MPRPRLGSARLKAVETVAALVRVGNGDADVAVTAAGLIPRCLDLFLLFPFNNLLHHQVRPRLHCMFSTSMPSSIASPKVLARLLYIGHFSRL